MTHLAWAIKMHLYDTLSEHNAHASLIDMTDWSDMGRTHSGAIRTSHRRYIRRWQMGVRQFWHLTPSPQGSMGSALPEMDQAALFIADAMAVCWPAGVQDLKASRPATDLALLFKQVV